LAAQIEEDILAEGVQIIWILEVDSGGRAGTAESCRAFMDARGSDKGICVGDGETMPNPGVWDRSPFAIGRGFDIMVRRSDMKIGWVSTHGTPGGNENLTQQELLQAIQDFARQ
jgi:hypothetical protein